MESKLIAQLIILKKRVDSLLTTSTPYRVLTYIEYFERFMRIGEELNKDTNNAFIIPTFDIPKMIGDSQFISEHTMRKLSYDIEYCIEMLTTNTSTIIPALNVATEGAMGKTARFRIQNPDTASVWLKCSNCKVETDHKVMTRVNSQDASEDNDIQVADDYDILSCRGCGTICFRHYSACTEDADPTVHVYSLTNEINEDAISVQVIPAVIQESLSKFKIDFPDPNKAIFVMMQFIKKAAHDEIFEGINTVLDSHGLFGVRADFKQYHDDVFPNVMTYMYGCRYGIAVFERIENEAFNPNVSLEVGYMMAMNKAVCLLKDRTLKTLHTDLVGKLYKEFDPKTPKSTIPGEVTQWLRDKGIIQASS